MFKILRRASVLVFTRRRTLNLETLNPKTLKTLNPKAEYIANTQYFLQFLFSCSTTGNPSMLQSGQTTGSVRQVSYIMLYIYIIYLWFVAGNIVFHILEIIIPND